MLIKSKEALAYVRSFVLQVPGGKRLCLGGKDKPLFVETTIYYKHKFRADLSDELIMDCLTKAGVIKDDRYIVQRILIKRCDIKEPRAEISVTETDSWFWG